MKRMVEHARDLEKLAEYVHQEGSTTEIGGNVEIDGAFPTSTNAVAGLGDVTVTECEAVKIGNIVVLHFTAEVVPGQTTAALQVAESEFRPSHAHAVTGIRYTDSTAASGVGQCYGSVKATGEILLYGLTATTGYFDVFTVYAI